MHRPPAWIAALLVVGLSASGCHQPLPPAPSVTPEPTFACTPEAGGGPSFSCDRRQHEEMVVKEALYAEAERVYREFYAEDTRIQWHSGEAVPSDVIKRTVTGNFLTQLTKTYSAIRQQGFSGGGSEPVLAWVRRKPASSMNGSIIALESCVDATQAKVLVKGKPAGVGIRAQNALYFVRVDGSLKIADIMGGEVEKC